MTVATLVCCSITSETPHMPFSLLHHHHLSNWFAGLPWLVLAVGGRFGRFSLILVVVGRRRCVGGMEAREEESCSGSVARFAVLAMFGCRLWRWWVITTSQQWWCSRAGCCVVLLLLLYICCRVDWTHVRPVSRKTFSKNKISSILEREMPWPLAKGGQRIRVRHLSCYNWLIVFSFYSILFNYLVQV